MNHSFNVAIAVEYGVNAAILLENIHYWISKNMANNKHFYDGHYWTYNSVKAFTELFPYMDKNKITRTLKKLEDDGLLIEGNYNDDQRDRTKWYALTEEGLGLFENDSLQLPKTGNADKENEKSYIYNNIYKDSKTDINNQIILDSKESNRQTADAIQQVVDAWNALEPYGINPVKRMSRSSKRCHSLNARLKEYGLEEVLKTVDSIKGSDFLLGRTSSAFLISFDWFVKPENFPKVNEGKYLNRSMPLPSQPQQKSASQNGEWE